MPECPKCKRKVDELVLAGSYKYSMKGNVYLCHECARKMNKAHDTSMGVFFVLFILWLAGIFLGVIPEEFFMAYLFGGIIGLPILLFVLYKGLEG